MLVSASIWQPVGVDFQKGQVIGMPIRSLGGGVENGTTRRITL
jgi:hypothetical protein